MVDIVNFLLLYPFNAKLVFDSHESVVVSILILCGLSSHIDHIWTGSQLLTAAPL